MEKSRKDATLKIPGREYSNLNLGNSCDDSKKRSESENILKIEPMGLNDRLKEIQKLMITPHLFVFSNWKRWSFLYKNYQCYKDSQHHASVLF